MGEAGGWEAGGSKDGAAVGKHGWLPQQHAPWDRGMSVLHMQAPVYVIPARKPGAFSPHLVVEFAGGQAVERGLAAGVSHAAKDLGAALANHALWREGRSGGWEGAGSLR